MGAAERTETLNIPMRDLFNVVADFGSYAQFVTGMKRCEVLGETPTGAKRVVFDIEMMKRVSYVINAEQSIDDAAGTARVSWVLESSDFLKKNNGTWELKALSPTSTHVVYKLEVDFNVPVPGFILKGLIANSLPTAIREFSERAKKVAAR